VIGVASSLVKLRWTDYLQRNHTAFGDAQRRREAWATRPLAGDGRIREDAVPIVSAAT